ncbi:ESX secretion-associated protein EspG [Aldersonia sp. NBC_00410]|uniref:ESX secretion-associated protein EspG n=1 Tax=Aldersonia sp. NBC_00410 TaxID=2975954 RepID=UPI002256BB60|nr:ESX secretion-associated protein EspG [Aldersonia sp. NBC_00410]MCX5042290.1 ESX secretion-associated protein EspG [Aldersonia sp. NBC_00410]
MIDLGTGHTPSSLESVRLGLDEMQWLLESLEDVDLPVVLDTLGRYDNADEHDAAMRLARESLDARGLLDGDAVTRELEDRLQVLGRPHWVVALRLFTGEQISRLCVARGADMSVLALRGPQSYLISELTGDPAGPVVAALGPAQPLAFGGLNAPTEQLSPIFDDTGDPDRTSNHLQQLGAPANDAAAVGNAMLHCFSHAEIVGIGYGDGVREQAPGHLAVFDTHHGRFLATASEALDGTKWTALSPGSDTRIRQALQTLMNGLPEESPFPYRRV